VEQAALNFNRPKPHELFPSDCQDRRLYERLLLGPISNVQMRDDLRLLSYTRRLSTLREKGIKIKKQHIRDGVFEYSLGG